LESKSFAALLAPEAEIKGAGNSIQEFIGKRL
jgi:hypothetical protein